MHMCVCVLGEARGCVRHPFAPHMITTHLLTIKLRAPHLITTNLLTTHLLTTHLRTSPPQGVSFVLFQNRSSVKKAIEMFHGHSVNVIQAEGSSSPPLGLA